MSDPAPEDTKPSRFIEIFLWVVFVVPMIFVWLTVQSIPLIVILLVIRLGIMAYPRLKGQKQPAPVVVADRKKEVVALPPAPQVYRRTILNVIAEEAVAEWRGLLTFLRIYDENEDKFLVAYKRIKNYK
jgi:hypothetical protein